MISFCCTLRAAARAVSLMCSVFQAVIAWTTALLQVLFYYLKYPFVELLNSVFLWISSYVRNHDEDTRGSSIVYLKYPFVELLNSVFLWISSYVRNHDEDTRGSSIVYVCQKFLLPFLSKMIKRVPDPSYAEPVKYETQRSDVETELRTRLKDYSLESLSDMGSRMCRFWFRVSPVSDPETKRVLSVSKEPTKAIRTDPTLINKLFQQLQPHPYIQPVLMFGYVQETPNVFLIQPELKSLKDCIYGVYRYDADWGKKYSARSKGLGRDKVALFGRQILEALLFLYEMGFPPLGHVHSGNVFVEGDVCKLGGYEELLPMPGYKSRLLKMFKDHPLEQLDVLMFGHLVFEMAAGYELTTTAPTEEDYKTAESKSSEIVDVLMFIFSCVKLEDVLAHSFFQATELYLPIPKIRLTKDVQLLLKSLRTPSKKKKSIFKKKKCPVQ